MTKSFGSSSAAGNGLKLTWATALGWRLLLAVVYGFGKSVAERRGGALGAIFSLLTIWLAALAYLAWAPVKYTSQWTFILPTSTSSTSVDVENIGHAQSTASSPFGSATSSPKVIYKEIANSEVVRTKAAALLGITLSELGRARITLVDETSLINFAVEGQSPQAAQGKAKAIIEAFNEQLDQLRFDEVKRRSDVVRGSLVNFEENLKAAREQILNFQQKSGLFSVSQFTDASSSAELLRRKAFDVRSDIARLKHEQASLVQMAGLKPERAAEALKLIADPVVSKLAAELSDAYASYRQSIKRLGTANPGLMEVQARVQTTTTELRRIAEQSGFSSTEALTHYLTVNSGSNIANILQSMVSNEANLQGRLNELSALESEIDGVSKDLKKISLDAAVLEDLKRNHLVAEAVFTSALARRDSNTVDIYGSYPMVQTLAAPDLPQIPSSPDRLIAFGGAALASFFALLAWGLAWCSRIFTHRRSKSA